MRNCFELFSTPPMTQSVKRQSSFYLLACALAMGSTALSGCSSLTSMAGGDTLDYRGRSAKTATLEVPPDLTQIQRDGRYAPQNGSVSATTFQTGPTGVAATAAPQVALNTAGEFRLMRNGTQRWLVTSQAPEKLWPQVKAFWEDLGFELTVNNAQVGVMETNWAENRAKLGADWLRRNTGILLDSLFSTGERDKYRTRMERAVGSNGTEISITHFGMQEVYTTAQRDRTAWTSRANDPQLEGELLQRLMVRLGVNPDEAAKVVASSTPGASPTARARVVEGQPTATLQVDDNFDRAWRRVGQALDRNGFSVEDRDRSSGTYFVRYADPRLIGNEDPSFFSRIFSGATSGTPQRYRVGVKADGERSTVTVQNDQGGNEAGEVGKRIVALLLDELR
jgi:outer membrane protein assembly factor BamC